MNKSIKNEELMLEINIASIPDNEWVHNFIVYKFYPTSPEPEKEEYVKGFIKYDGCVDFEFNQEGCLLHSCDIFNSLIADLKWIQEQLEEYAE